MPWTLTKADTDSAPQTGQQTYEEALRQLPVRQTRRYGRLGAVQFRLAV